MWEVSIRSRAVDPLQTQSECSCSFSVIRNRDPEIAPGCCGASWWGLPYYAYHLKNVSTSVSYSESEDMSTTYSTMRQLTATSQRVRIGDTLAF